MQFKCDVLETSTVIKVYTVEAKSKKEARKKLESGETIFEEEVKSGEVISREIVSEIERDD